MFEKTKHCSSCNELKYLKEFTLLLTGKYYTYCKQCKIKKDKIYRSKERLQKYRQKTLQERYGITKKQYNRLIKKQDNRCAICRLPETTSQKYERRHLALDHCHETFSIRGFLCFNCNIGIGKFKDDPILLRQAAEYLERSNSLNQKNRVVKIEIVYEDGTSETFREIYALYSKSTNWKKDSSGKIVEEWIEHNIVWTQEPAIYEHINIPESPKELEAVEEINEIKAEDYMNDPNFCGIEYGVPKFKKAISHMEELDMGDLLEGYGNGQP